MTPLEAGTVLTLAGLGGAAFARVNAGPRWRWGDVALSALLFVLADVLLVVWT